VFKYCASFMDPLAPGFSMTNIITILCGEKIPRYTKFPHIKKRDR
jgi:hypothetical protein